jgi:hypothetical protein
MLIALGAVFYLSVGTVIAFIPSRLMPAWIDSVEYKEFGRATITATLFGGMDHPTGSNRACSPKQLAACRITSRTVPRKR